jgi:purine-binding chemotaxis protein CheW
MREDKDQSYFSKMEDLSIDVEKFTGLVIFCIDDWEFCINFQDVALILRGDELKNIKNINTFLHRDDKEKSDNFMSLDLGVFFGLKEKKPIENSRFLCIQNNTLEFGFFVDSIKEIITIDRDFVHKKLEFISIASKDYIKGLIKFEKRTFLYPDYNRIVATLLKQKE